MGEFDGSIYTSKKEEPVEKHERKFQKLPEQKPATEEEWAEESNRKLRERGSPYKVVSTKRYLISIILLIIIAMGGLTYFIMNDYFKPNLNSTCMLNTTCEAPTIPSCPSCSLTCPTTNITSINMPNGFWNNYLNYMNNTNST